VAGTSLLVSYTKAKGEMALSQRKINPQELNRLFSSGLASYETRTVLLIVGLIFAVLPQILIVLLFANTYTCIYRVIKVSKELRETRKEQ
jgi:hypothetical protein